VTAERSRPGCDEAAPTTTTVKVYRKEYPHGDEPIELALAAIGLALDIRDALRRLDDLLDGGAP
jgi:hypothetical protein